MEIPGAIVASKSKGHLGKIDGLRYNSVIAELGKSYLASRLLTPLNRTERAPEICMAARGEAKRIILRPVSEVVSGAFLLSLVTVCGSPLFLL